jgi:septal ring factor EnvC (AmiA/AmiB activator)
MEELRRQVRRAQWRLGVQRFASAVGWSCFGTLLAAAVLIAVDKYRPLGVEPWGWLVGAVGVGVLGAALWALGTGPGPVDAAMEIDRRFGLKERVSSSLSLTEDERQSEIGQALVADAARRVGRIDLAEHFGVSPGRQLLLPLAPALVAFVVAMFVPAARENPAEARTDAEALRQQIEKSQQSLQIRLAEKREQARKEGLKEAQDLFLRLERELSEASKALGDKSDALAKLHDLADQLEKRRQELGGADTVEKQLEQLKNLSQGPADKFLQALAKGDVKLAMRELEKLKKDLAEGKLDEAQRKALANQVAEMQKKLQQLTEAHRKTQDDLKAKIDQLRKAGQDAEADKLQEQLRKLQQQQPQMNQLQELANKLGQCAKCMEAGQADEAAKMLEEMAADLEGLAEQLDEFKMLKEAMDELDAARQRMLCPKCGGVGCDECEGDKGFEGEGLGKGRGAGPRPEEENPVDFYNTRTPPKVRPGAGVVVGEVDGPTVKGDVRQRILQEVEKAKAQPADPLTEQRMSRKHRQHAQEYFDKFREGK